MSIYHQFRQGVGAIDELFVIQFSGSLLDIKVDLSAPATTAHNFKIYFEELDTVPSSPTYNTRIPMLVHDDGQQFHASGKPNLSFVDSHVIPAGLNIRVVWANATDGLSYKLSVKVGRQ